MKQKVVAIVGPTAAGKTSLSINLAKSFNGEVISADSRQVYKGLDIGSGKVTAEEMEGVTHHLLDVADPMTIYTGVDFKRQATTALETILDNQKLPIIAGGTFFYVELLRGSMHAAPVEPDYVFRSQLESFSDQELFEKLQEKDARRAETIDRHNRHRLIRSLEIIKVLGKVPEVASTESDYDWLVLGIDIDKETLHKNINTRLTDRLNEGMVEEVEQLLADGVTHERLEQFGLEYRYISRFIRGEITKEDMQQQLETKIRQFAKRQMTWLKKDDSIVWIDPSAVDHVSELVETFLNS